MKFYDYVLRFKDDASDKLAKVSRYAVNVTTSTGRAQMALGKLADESDKTGRAFGNLHKHVMAYFTFDALRGLLGGVVQTTAEFEKFEAVLTTALGSRSAAQAAMRQISDFAARTPFGVDQLTGSYVKLANRGFRPTTEQMTKLGDLAASQGKTFDQLTEATLDAQTGEFERLKEFGITAYKHGNQVAFSFKNQTTTVANSSAAIQQYILGLGAAKGVQGTMATMSRTLGGMLSNLGDQFKQLQLAVGQTTRGPLAWFIKAISGAIGYVTTHLPQLSALAVALAPAALALGAYAVGQRVAAWATDQQTKALIRQRLAAMSNPYVLIASAVAVLVTSLIYLYQTSAGVRGFFDRMGGAIGAAISRFSGWVQGVWAGVNQIAKGVWEVYSSLLAGVFGLAQNAWNAVAGFATAAWNWVVGLWGGLTKWLAGVWYAVVGGARTAWVWVRGLMSQGVAWIRDALAPITSFLDKLFDPLLNGAQKVFGKVKSWLLGLFDGLGGKVADALGIDVAGIKRGLESMAVGTRNVSNTNSWHADKIADGYAKGKAGGVKALLEKGAGSKAPDALGANPDVGAAVGTASGAGQVRNVQVHIAKQVETLNIHTQTLKESAGQVVQSVEEWMVRAVAGAELALS